LRLRLKNLEAIACAGDDQRRAASQSRDGGERVADTLAAVQAPDEENREIAAAEADRVPRGGASAGREVRRGVRREESVVDGVRRREDARRRRAVGEQVLASARANGQETGVARKHRSRPGAPRKTPN